jgi:hypothetical protein
MKHTIAIRHHPLSQQLSRWQIIQIIDANMASININDKNENRSLTKSSIADEATLWKLVRRNYARTSFKQFSEEGYAHFAYTVEGWRWDMVPRQEMPLDRPSMDRLWIKMVMDFWMKMAWCWKQDDAECITLALLEVSFLGFGFISYIFANFFIERRWTWSRRYVGRKD